MGGEGGRKGELGEGGIITEGSRAKVIELGLFSYMFQRVDFSHYTVHHSIVLVLQ